MPKKAYLEICNVCNLNCDFCHKTKRSPRFMSKEEFSLAAKKLRGFADYLYFHLMGEPLLHPLLQDFFEIAGELGYRVMITTNGILLPEKESILLNSSSLGKVSISLHSYEANTLGISLDEYLDACFSFCKKCAEKGVVCVMRLWNEGGKNELNTRILDAMEKAFPKPWKSLYSGEKIANYVFLEWGERFEWPDETAENIGERHSCYGLRDQVGVLCDGSVVPCCLDADGAITLGNIFTDELSDILSTPRAVALKRSFEQKRVCEELCRRCGFAKRFK